MYKNIGCCLDGWNHSLCIGDVLDYTGNVYNGTRYVISETTFGAEGSIRFKLRNLDTDKEFWIQDCNDDDTDENPEYRNFKVIGFLDGNEIKQSRELTKIDAKNIYSVKDGDYVLYDGLKWKVDYQFDRSNSSNVLDLVYNDMHEYIVFPDIYGNWGNSFEIKEELYFTDETSDTSEFKTNHETVGSVKEGQVYNYDGELLKISRIDSRRDKDCYHYNKQIYTVVYDKVYDCMRESFAESKDYTKIELNGIHFYGHSYKNLSSFDFFAETMEEAKVLIEERIRVAEQKRKEKEQRERYLKNLNRQISNQLKCTSVSFNDDIFRFHYKNIIVSLKLIFDNVAKLPKLILSSELFGVILPYDSVKCVDSFDNFSCDSLPFDFYREIINGREEIVATILSGELGDYASLVSESNMKLFVIGDTCLFVSYTSDGIGLTSTDKYEDIYSKLKGVK